MPTTRPGSGLIGRLLGHSPLMDSATATTLAATRTVRFLEHEPIVWVSTVRPDGTPHLVPTWFWWDGEALLVFSKPNAQKIRNVRVNPSVMLALGDPEDDFDVGLIRGRAELLTTRTVDVLPAAFLAKYSDRIAALTLTATEFAATYSQVVRIVPDVFLGWHGRTTPRSARIAGAPAVSIDEPRRANSVGVDGEPVSRRRPRERLAPRIVEPTRNRRSLRDRLPRTVVHALRVGRGFGEPSLGARPGLFGEPSPAGA
jgi:PPOX class probable F420-dependent enzyme